MKSIFCLDPVEVWAKLEVAELPVIEDPAEVCNVFVVVLLPLLALGEGQDKTLLLLTFSCRHLGNEISTDATGSYLREPYSVCRNIIKR